MGKGGRGKGEFRVGKWERVKGWEKGGGLRMGKRRRFKGGKKGRLKCGEKRVGLNVRKKGEV